MRIFHDHYFLGQQHSVRVTYGRLDVMNFNCDVPPISRPCFSAFYQIPIEKGHDCLTVVRCHQFPIHTWSLA